MARIGSLPAWDQLTGRAARAPVARGGFDNASVPVVERFEGGNLPSERDYIDRIAGPAKVPSKKEKPESRPVAPITVTAPATQQ